MSNAAASADELIRQYEAKKEEVIALFRHRGQQKAEARRIAKDFSDDIKELDEQLEKAMEDIELLQMQIRAKDEEARIKLPTLGG